MTRSRLVHQPAQRWFQALALALFLSPIIACSSGTETGNPSLTGSLSYAGYSSAPDRYGVGRPGSVAAINAAWFALDRVTTSSCEANVRGFDAPALGIGNHAAGSHNVTPFTASAGAFCSVRVPFLEVSGDAETAGFPPALTGHSLLLGGALADGTPFTILSDQRPVVELRAANGRFELGSGNADLLLAFDFARWLDAVDLTAAEPRTDGSIVVSATENSQLLLSFDAQLATGISLYRDRGADGVIDLDPELLAGAR